MNGMWMSGAAWLWLALAACALAAGGCRSAAPGGVSSPARPAAQTGDGLSVAARDFIKGYEAAAAGSAERAQWLARHACPYAGPRPALLVEAAAVDAVKMGQAVFLGCARVETGFEPSPALAEALKSAGAPAPHKAATGPGAAGAVWMPAPKADYYAAGEAAVVSVEMRRGDGWRYRQTGLFVWRAGTWERRGEVVTEGLGR